MKQTSIKIYINEFNKLDKLWGTVDTKKVSAYFGKKLGELVPRRKVKMEIEEEFRKYILSGGFEEKDG